MYRSGIADELPHNTGDLGVKMDIQFFGANCVAITTKYGRFVVDDTLALQGAKTILKSGDVALFTQSHPDSVPEAKIMIDLPGEYEVSGVNIHGLQSRAHTDNETERNATMYKLVAGDVKILVTGHIHPKLSEAKLEDIGLVDVMVIPVGGNGYTLDPEGAAQVIKQVEPKVVILTHYDDKELSFEVPAQSLDSAMKVIGLEPKEVTKKFQYKAGEGSETTKLVVLEKS